MVSIHIPDDVFADYLSASEGNAEEAKNRMKQAVFNERPKEARDDD